MPSKTAKQAKLMRAVAHGFKPDQFKGPSKTVAKEFVRADKAKNSKHVRAKARKSKLDKWAKGNAKSSVSEYST